MRAAFASSEITPPVGVPMAGNVRADRASRGVHDALRATAMVLDGTDGAPVVVIGCDLLCMTHEISTPVRERLATGLGCGPERIAVCATHTHSGPQIERYSPTAVPAAAAGAAWREWIAGLPDRLIAVAEQALGRLLPARVSLGSTPVRGVAFNRRLRLADGTTAMNWEGVDPGRIAAALGPVDERLTALRVVGPDGDVLGIVVHFTLHPAILVGAEWLLGRDFVDPLTRLLQADHGDVPVLFLNGAEGNVNHIDPAAGRATDPFATCARVGAALAAAAGSALSVARPVGERLQVAPIRIQLRTRPITGNMLSAAKARLDVVGGVVPSLLDGVPPEAYDAWLLRQAPRHPDAIAVDTAVAAVGGMTLAFCPGEPFAEFGRDLQSRLPDRHALVVGLSNQNAGYLPTRAAYDEGGYEPTFGTSVVAAGEPERFFDRAAEVAASFDDSPLPAREATR